MFDSEPAPIVHTEPRIDRDVDRPLSARRERLQVTRRCQHVPMAADGSASEFDFDAYIQRARTGPCFVCKTVERDPDFLHEIVYEDDSHIAFLDRYPTTYGYVLVCPKQHVELVTGDLALDDYLALQRVIYAVGEAVRTVVRPARLYLASLGSTYGNSHIHWHVIPIPEGLPQNTTWLSKKLAGVASVAPDDLTRLAQDLRDHLQLPE